MVPALFDLTGRVALVTGAGQNMGRHTALAIAEAGADMLICDVVPETLEQTAHDIAALGRRVIPVPCDIYDFDQIRAMYALLDREFGRIDVLANIPGGNHLWHPEEITVEDFQETIRRVLVWKFLSCREGGRRMLQAGKGSIINMASLGGVNALGRGNFAYSVAMGGVIQMTRELSTEWASRGVRVNAIAPAQITNPGFDRRMAETPGLRENFLRGIPMGRLGVPSDIAGLALFLASDASGFTTGAVIPLDGGNLAMNAGGTHSNRAADPPPAKAAS
jgi:NAD(P)-dependent dehydrogenase (short-subunit alcohol dehydrogenase family)